MIGDIVKNQTPVSHYQPSKEVADFTSYVRKDYSHGNEILHRSWTELNNRSIVDDQDRGRRTFNAFVDEEIEDPATAWQWRGTRSKARNQAIALHAQLTAGYIVPNFMAQNDSDEEDMDFSEMMRDTVEWMVNNSNYKDSFLQATMGMLVNPVTFMGAEYANVFQTIKTKLDTGKYIKEEVIDEVLSGFNAPVYGATDVLISNAYEQNIQKHRYSITRRYIEYGEAHAKYHNHENWQYVQPGVRSLYSDDDGLFYDNKDDDHPSMVEEVKYKNRRDDTEVCFLNGIYFGDADVEANPIRHRDNKGAPKYNVVPFGYQRVNEHFFYYKSLMNSQYWDNQLLDAQYQIGMNRAFLDANMPIAISGTDKVDSDVIFPSSVVSFEDPNTKIAPLLPQANTAAMFQAMDKVENSLEESSISGTTAGQLPQASQKATSVAIANKHAETMLQGVGKTLAQSIVQFGDLMKDISIQHLVVPQVDEILGGGIRLKYKTLSLQKKMVNGKEVSKVLRFDESLLGTELTAKQKKMKAMALLEETNYPNGNREIYLVNPEMFSRFRYLTVIEPEKMFPENEEYQQAIMSQIYAQFADNPFISLEALTRKSLYKTFRSETEELMKEEGEGEQQVPEAPGQTQFGQQAQNSATATSVPSAGRVWYYQ